MPGPLDLSNAEIDQYSIKHYVQSGLAALGWDTVFVDQVRDGWPVYEEIEVPGVYVLLENGEPAPYELGSHGNGETAHCFIYGENDAQRTRLADTIKDFFRDTIPIFNFVDGNETSPEINDYFVTDSVRWEKIASTAITPDKEKWRSVVTATLRRQVA